MDRSPLPYARLLVKGFVFNFVRSHKGRSKETGSGMTMTPSGLTLPGDPPVEVTLRRSSRARRLSLRVSQLDGRVTLTLPTTLPLSAAHTFLAAQDSWLRHHLGGLSEPCPVIEGCALPVLGRPRTIRRGAVRAARIEDDAIIIPPAGPVGPRVKAALLLLARSVFDARVTHFATHARRTPGPITLRDPRGRWGSCAGNGRLMFSWRLMLAPAEVLDYVVAHEVAHLVRMDHSPAFWAEVARLYPDHRAQRHWLRSEGAGLHRYRFDAG